MGKVAERELARINCIDVEVNDHMIAGHTKRGERSLRAGCRRRTNLAVCVSDQGYERCVVFLLIGIEVAVVVAKEDHLRRVERRPATAEPSKPVVGELEEMRDAHRIEDAASC